MAICEDEYALSTSALIRPEKSFARFGVSLSATTAQGSGEPL